MEQIAQEPNDKNNDTEARISENLVRRIKAGEDHALAEAWLRYNDKIRASVWRYTNSRDDIDDRVSATWVIAIPKLRAGELINSQALCSFLCGIARLVALGELRKNTWLSLSGDQQFLEQSLTDTLTPQIKLQQYQDVQTTLAMIENMAVDRDQDLISMKFIDEASRDTLCTTFKVTPLQLSKLISRARKRLRDQAIMQSDLLPLCSERA